MARVVLGRRMSTLVLVGLLTCACGPVAASMWSYWTQVSNAPIVLQAIERTEAHPTIRELLGSPVTVSTIVTKSQNLSYSSGGTSNATWFWRPGVTLKRISMLTTTQGPKGSAWFAVTGTEDLTTGQWRDVRMEVYGSNLGDVRSFHVDLTHPELPGDIVRGP